MNDFFENLETKDKIAKLLQYGSMLFVWHFQRKGNLRKVDQWKKVGEQAESFRKIGVRFFDNMNTYISVVFLLGGPTLATLPSPTATAGPQKTSQEYTQDINTYL